MIPLMILANFMPDPGTPQRSLAILILIVAVFDLITLLVVLVGGLNLYVWYREQKNRDTLAEKRKERLAVATERMLELTTERLERSSGGASYAGSGPLCETCPYFNPETF